MRPNARRWFNPRNYCQVPYHRRILTMTLYTLEGPISASRDYLATGDLGPVHFVSGGRMRRDLTLSGYYAGSLYVESAALIGPEASQIKGDHTLQQSQRSFPTRSMEMWLCWQQWQGHRME